MEKALTLRSSEQNNKADVAKNKGIHMRGKQDIKPQQDQAVPKIESKTFGANVKKHNTTHRTRKH